MQSFHTMLAVTDESQIGEARRCAARYAEEAGLDRTECGRAALVATEMATNLLRHATDGRLLVGPMRVHEAWHVDLLAIDRGPGISNIDRCLMDGYSTAGTPGNGLGAIRRQSNEFDVHSAVPGGTVVFARISSAAAEKRASTYVWGFVNVPAPGENCSGDAWSVAERNGTMALIVVDGLGHGLPASDAANTAKAIFEKDPFESPSTTLARMSEPMRSTRGAAVAAAKIDSQSGTIRYVGVGNIAGHLLSRGPAGSRRGLVSHNGTVGAAAKIQEFEYACDEQMLLVMHSDGLQSRWTLDAYPGLQFRHPAVIAGVLYRDFARGRDDATVGVICMRKAGGAHA